jgi:hypothetical protein
MEVGGGQARGKNVVADAVWWEVAVCKRTQKRVLGVQQSEGEQGADNANSMTIATVFSTPPSPSNFKIQ